MKKIIGIITTLLAVGSFAYADLDMVKVPQIASVATNAAAVASSRAQIGEVSGLIEYIYVDVSGAASPDIDIDIVAIGGKGAGPERTLWSSDDISADTPILLREVAEDSAAGTTGIVNVGGKIPVVNETIRVDAYDANKAAINVDVYIFLTR